MTTPGPYGGAHYKHHVEIARAHPRDWPFSLKLHLEQYHQIELGLRGTTRIPITATNLRSLHIKFHHQREKR